MSPDALEQARHEFAGLKKVSYPGERVVLFNNSNDLRKLVDKPITDFKEFNSLPFIFVDPVFSNKPGHYVELNGPMAQAYLEGKARREAQQSTEVE